jgi:hypothetical protein
MPATVLHGLFFLPVSFFREKRLELEDFRLNRFHKFMKVHQILSIKYGPEQSMNMGRRSNWVQTRKSNPEDGTYWTEPERSLCSGIWEGNRVIGESDQRMARPVDLQSLLEGRLWAVCPPQLTRIREREKKSLKPISNHIKDKM